MDAEEQAMLEWLNSVNAAKAPKAMVPAMPQPSPMPSIEALSGGTIPEEMAQPTPMLPSMPSAPMTAPSPLSVAQSRLGSLYDRTSLADSVASQQAAVRQELLGAYTPKKIGWQNALITSLVGLAPALVASAVLDGDQYAPIIAKAGSEGLASSGKLYDEYLAGEMKGRQAAAQFDLGNLSQDINQLQALDKVALQGEYDLAAQEARARLGGNAAQNRIVQSPVEAKQLLDAFGVTDVDPSSLIGMSQGMIQDALVNKRLKEQKEGDWKLRERGLGISEKRVSGEALSAPKQDVTDKVSSAATIHERLAPMIDILEKSGASIANAAQWQAEKLIPGTNAYFIEAQLNDVAAGLRKANESGVMTDQDYQRYQELISGVIYAPPSVKAQQLKNVLANIKTSITNDLQTARASKQNVDDLEALASQKGILNSNASVPAQQPTDRKAYLAQLQAEKARGWK